MCFIDYITKPFKAPEMCEAIKRLTFAASVKNLKHNYDGYNCITVKLFSYNQ